MLNPVFFFFFFLPRKCFLFFSFCTLINTFKQNVREKCEKERGGRREREWGGERERGEEREREI